MTKTLISTAILLVLSTCATPVEQQNEVPTTKYIASQTLTAPVYTIKHNEGGELSIIPSGTLLRGSKVDAYSLHTADAKALEDSLEILLGRPVSLRNGQFSRIIYNGVEYVLESSSLADSLRAVTIEKEVFVKHTASILADTTTFEICGLAERESKLAVLQCCGLEPDGHVRRYKVLQPETGKVGYIYGKYVALTPEEAAERYRAEYYDSLFTKVRSPYKGGDAAGCELYPREKRRWTPEREMPDTCRGLYLTISPYSLQRIEEYIEVAKSGRVNTFVIDLMDDAAPGYRADAMLKHSPTNYKHTGTKKIDLYTNAVNRLHEEGFWVVGRITCFKNQYLVTDHPEYSIIEKATGKPLYHNKSYWPSAYDRRVWQFLAELAVESVNRFGFDEINFDYVRFPDKMISIDNLIDFHNVYGESKVQAIQRFVQYVADEVHEAGAYMSVDVFGECANPDYVTAYGQYWPAISNIADAICGMPYPDHLPDHYAGISKPWNHPREALRAWGRRAASSQSKTPTPARVRTWVQAYHVMRHVDPNGIDYNAYNISLEIKGLQDAGVCDGYVTWLSSGNIDRYRDIVSGL